MTEGTARRDGDLAPHELRILAAVDRERSFTAAAAALGLTQSAVSHAVRTLEGKLGAVLFDRGRHGARPTPAGERAAAHARQVGPHGREVDHLSRNPAEPIRRDDVSRERIAHESRPACVQSSGRGIVNRNQVAVCVAPLGEVSGVHLRRRDRDRWGSLSGVRGRRRRGWCAAGVSGGVGGGGRARRSRRAGPAAG